MKKDWSHLDRYRLTDERNMYSSPPGETFGAFRIRHPEKGHLHFHVIAVDGKETLWEHVSVHIEDINGTKRTPSWAEMDYIKNLFWEEGEVVVQYHIHGEDKVNVHPNCLHLWRSTTQPYPLPPKEFV